MRLVYVAFLLLVPMLYSESDLILLEDNKVDGSKKLIIKGDDEQCTISINSDNLPINSSCRLSTNSDKIRIFCTKTKKVCKTLGEVYESLSPAYAPKDSIGIYEVIAADTRIRYRPKKNSGMTATAAKGDKVTVYGTAGEWAETKQGWISTKQLKLIKRENAPISNKYTFPQSIGAATAKAPPVETSGDTSTKKKTSQAKTIVTTGYGENKEEALKNAFKSAVERYVGVLVDADTVVKNNKVIKDEILTASNGYIQSYDEISTKKSGDLIEVEIKALVKYQEVFDKVKSLDIATSAINNTKDIYAKVISKRVAKEDAEKILKKSIEDLMSSKSIREILVLGITDVNVDEDGIKDNKIPVTISYMMEINYKVYKQKIAQLEQTFEGLGAKLNKREDIPYFNRGKLNVQNKRKIEKLSATDFGFIRHYGKGYKLDVWSFPKVWADVFPFNTDLFLNWKNSFILILEIKRANGEVMIAKNITKKCNYENILLTNIHSGRYYHQACSKNRAKNISPFFWNRSNPSEKVSYVYKIWVDLEDIKDLGSMSIELDEI